MREPEWAVVVPLKRLARAKTRLRGAAPGVPHERLVLALAQDTVRAVVDCPLVAEVLAVTDDPRAAEALAALGARVLPDRPDAGLNPAIAYAAGLAAPSRPVAALTADLPALRPADLAGALSATSAAPQRRGFVADAAGTGTTMLAWAPARPVTPARPATPACAGQPAQVALDPRFGPDSAARHVASGAQRLRGDWPTLRRDVDTAADLAEAARLGLGPHTRRLWRPFAAPPAARHRARPG